MSEKTGEALQDFDFDVLYEGWGMDVRNRFVEPALSRSERYDRLTGYFTLHSLLAVAEGIDKLWRQGGRMRLVIGIHDIPPDVLKVRQLDEDDVGSVIEAVRNRLLDEVSTIDKEFQRDRLATLAWMMQDGLLQIRVACPVAHDRLPDEGIFHKKRLIFRDSEDNILVGVGSPNETAAGFQENIEELTVFRNWNEGQRPLVERHVESFDTIWNNGQEYIEVVDIDDSFADELLNRLGSPDRPAAIPEVSVVDVDDILETAKRSPAYSILSFEGVGLYPHQERVFVEALSRWPVRALLADEVGLGKTLEAGAILAYLLEYGGVDEVTILAPANLLNQWQEELSVHFGLEFWRWDSTDRCYVSPEGNRWEGSLNGSPVGPQAPSKVLISAQLARGTRKRGHIFQDTDRRPEVLMVDEAHAARVRPTLDGSFRPTRLWRTLADIVDQIPHLLLMTATPLQTNLEEYHALLELLGLPEPWQDLGAYKRSLEILSKGDGASSLRNAQWMLKLIGSSSTEMDYEPSGLTPAQEEILAIAKDCDGNPSFTEANKVLGDWQAAYQLLVLLHPAHMLTLRNSRTSLVERGYRFPERRFESPAIDIPEPVARFYDGLHEYLWDAYGQVEKAADPDSEISLGFAKSSYHQRTASSLNSAIRSLENRLEKIEKMAAGDDADEDILTSEFEEPDVEEDEESSLEDIDTEKRKLERAKSIETTYIKDLLGRLEGTSEQNHIQDPKIDAMLRLLKEHLPADGILIFSRYTDTIDACLDAFKKKQPCDSGVGFGMYTGDEAWISVAGKRTDATKQDVKNALEDEEIKVVFCSEAAAEGLNLQAARVMINIDVPWNPAKLEQRIGRIARLGQSADEVLIYNLWYPESVEAKMYTRLTERKDLYDVAVGQSPDIVSDAIRSQVSRGRSGEAVDTENALEELGEIRKSLQHDAIQRVWGPLDDSIPLSTKTRREFIQILARIAPDAVLEEDGSGRRLVVEDSDGNYVEASSQPEDRSILTLGHEIFHILTGVTGYLQDGVDLLVVEDADSNRPIGFCLAREDSLAMIPTAALPSLIGILMGEESIDDLLEEEEWLARDEVDLESETRIKARWLPEHCEMTVPFEGPAPDDGESPPPFWTRDLRLREL
ncbi:helicase-related protein [Haloarchaeobius sp. HRN-SO-5]|uniref:helicase-related protein n=1 Tax=Haloarchaeobius sp. HRN-SO-5 TaxID=3446118 RepID=UPI003EC00F51